MDLYKFLNKNYENLFLNVTYSKVNFYKKIKSQCATFIKCNNKDFLKTSIKFF